MLDVTTKEKNIRRYCEDVIEAETGNRDNSYREWYELRVSVDSEGIVRIAYDILRILDKGGR